MITVHRKLSANLKFFLESLGYECYFHTTDGTWDKLLVAGTHDEDLLSEIEEYANRWGFIPYHFALAPTKKGKQQKKDRLAFKAKLTEIRPFKALQGDFQLILFETRSQAYLWKSYSDSTPAPGDYEVTAKVKANITGRQGESIALVSHCRLKEK